MGRLPNDPATQLLPGRPGSGRPAPTMISRRAGADLLTGQRQARAPGQCIHAQAAGPGMPRHAGLTRPPTRTRKRIIMSGLPDTRPHENGAFRADLGLSLGGWGGVFDAPADEDRGLKTGQAPATQGHPGHQPGASRTPPQPPRSIQDGLFRATSDRAEGWPLSTIRGSVDGLVTMIRVMETRRLGPCERRRSLIEPDWTGPEL
jgi:hypothetical protein